MGFPEVTDFGEGVRCSVECLYRRWDGGTILPPNGDDLVDFLVALTTEGGGWLPSPNSDDVGMAAERLKNARILSSGEHFEVIEPTAGDERPSRLTKVLRTKVFSAGRELQE